jgi:hypothetical protein
MAFIDFFRGRKQASMSAARRQNVPRLDDVAQRIEPTTGWSSLDLPETERQILRRCAADIRERARRRASVSASRPAPLRPTPSGQKSSQFGSLQSTPSGGAGLLLLGGTLQERTQVAEALARDLQSALHRIDVAALVSQYVGETSKALEQLFDAAERVGGVLLFDEADALFGRRTNVKNANDRYANADVTYLLQRIETFRGAVILAVNWSQGLDDWLTSRTRYRLVVPSSGHPSAGF